jgi:glycosyltransferase involved in cell wall biosynthesis
LIAGDVLFNDPSAHSYARSLNQLAAGLPVEFLGWRDDVRTVLRELDILVVPSTREPGTPRVILEAYASRVPVVAFPTGGIPEVVTNGETGFLVEPVSADALATRLVELIRDQPDRLRQAAAAGHAAWQSRFTLERYRREVIAVMTETARQSVGRS